VTDPSD